MFRLLLLRAIVALAVLSIPDCAFSQDDDRNEPASVVAKEVLQPFIGGELEGTWIAAYEHREPVFEQFRKSSDEFTRSDQRWENKYEVRHIKIAPGADMAVAFENRKAESEHGVEQEGTILGDHSRWSWTIVLVGPTDADFYEGVSLKIKMRGEVETFSFRLTGRTLQEGKYMMAHYQFAEGKDAPIDRILRHLVKETAPIAYRLSTGPPEVGPVSNGSLTRNSLEALTQIVEIGSYKNINDTGNYFADWMYLPANNSDVEPRRWVNVNGEPIGIGQVIKFKSGIVTIELQKAEDDFNWRIDEDTYNEPIATIHRSHLSDEDQDAVDRFVETERTKLREKRNRLSPRGSRSYRTWTSGEYKTVAKLVETKDGKVTLEKSDGKIIAVPLTLLSEKDQEYIRKIGGDSK